MNYLWLVICWLVYFTLHSVFALFQVKNLFLSMGLKQQNYRLIFNLFGILLLIPIFIFSSSIDSEYILSSTKFTKIIGLFLAGLGIVIVKVAFKSYDTKTFLGLGSLNPENEFKTDGLLKSVRHPLYSGSILLILGYFFFDPKISTLISAFMMILYFLVGIQFEEKKLINLFGKKYIAYKKNTPMLIPKFWKKA